MNIYAKRKEFSWILVVRATRKCLLFLHDLRNVRHTWMSIFKCAPKTYICCMQIKQWMPVSSGKSWCKYSYNSIVAAITFDHNNNFVVSSSCAELHRWICKIFNSKKKHIICYDTGIHRNKNEKFRDKNKSACTIHY